MSCPDCFKGAVLEGEPTGVISTEFEGAYFATGGNAKRAIILLTDIFGLPLKNSKILADNFAKHLDCDVWIPDLFQGHPPVGLDQLQLPERAGVKLGFFAMLKLVWSILPSIPALIGNRPAVVNVRTISFVKKLQEAKKYERIGAIGYCFGGGVATQVGASEPDLFNSIILVHPSPPSDAHIKAIKAPTAWSCAEDDMGIKPARVNEIEALYAARKGKADFVDYEIKVYKAHGFGARPNFAYPDVKEGFEKAFQQAVDWFNKTIPA
ncbi:dienelactone hydrolase endo-1-3,1,4-beta-D-glucanase [Mycena rosella]|uniref:Dienelactone hydrolase endo-1-3,1,4-beta-D-glucanase n=1 Tax=Mycena rosella TaxID=1033263 RepID=A0AAD7CYE9_MYCRO|nr:dienelactone hydrolase endo-1-3,1,4-beta-D-glucanase [Mycena rosella]